MFFQCETDARLDGKVAVVTGGSAGLGFETARGLAQHGVRVVIASRDPLKANDARERILRETPRAEVVTRNLDLASVKSIRGFVSETVLAERRLDILVNNVGALALPDELTEDGLHLMMQVNYFGAFLLTYLLIPLLRSSAPSRIVNVSAASMYLGTVDFEHMNRVGYWSSLSLLANSKLATAMFTVELDRRLQGTGVTANSMDPFLVADTDILKDMPGLIRDVGSLALRVFGRTRERVGAELLYLTAAPALETVSGKHFKFCHQCVNAWQTTDEALRRRLWDYSISALNISRNESWE